MSRPKPGALTFNSRVSLLFDYHEGFTDRLRQGSLRIFQDLSTEYSVGEFQKADLRGFTEIPLSLQNSIAEFLLLSPASFPSTEYKGFVEDLGFGSIECRFANGGELRFRIAESIEPRVFDSGAEGSLFSLFFQLRDFTLALLDAAARGQNDRI
ncbi:MAG: hypothetical protein JNM27_03420 [Leptospirales bacterium]|nr:hypothetical protein [Leptospirales bacterium]